MKRLPAVLVFALALSLVALQKEPIPPYGGDDNPQHDGQPMFCVNHSNGKHAQNCSCRSMSADGEGCNPDGKESSACKVFCRKSACRCANPCST